MVQKSAEEMQKMLKEMFNIDAIIFENKIYYLSSKGVVCVSADKKGEKENGI
jgi:predicted transcriptional regulator